MLCVGRDDSLLGFASCLGKWARKAIECSPLVYKRMKSKPLILPRQCVCGCVCAHD